MGSLVERRTPAQLLWIIAASNALIITGFATLSLPAMRHGGQHPWYSFAITVLGLIGSLIAERALRGGINSDQWPESLLAVPRKLAAHPVSAILAGFLFIGAIAYVVFTSARHIGGAWIFLFPQMSLIRVQSYLRPEPKSDSLLQPSERPKPLQSENWGAQPRPFSN